MSPARRAVAGTAAAAVLLGTWASVGGAQTSDPSVSLDRTGTAAGEEMSVAGTGWRPGAVLIVELCGHGGLDGSTDCDVAHQRTAGVGDAGTFSTALRVGIPPTPCPCVVKVTDQSTHLAVTAAIAVQGVPTVPITEADAPVREVTIVDARLSGGSWTEWFGSASPRTLELTVQNTGNVAIADPGLTVTWGPGNAPTGFVDVPALGAMTPGATESIEVQLPREALSVGRFTAVAELPGLGDAARARVRDTMIPWGLLAVGVLLLQAVLLMIRNRLRRRIVGDPAGPSHPEPPPGDGPGEGADDVIDLTEPIWLDDRGRRPATHPVRHSSTQLAPVLTDHRDAAAAVQASLAASLAASASLVQDELQRMQANTRSSLLLAAGFNEALVAEVVQHAEAALVEAEDQRDAARQCFREASELLREAQHEADELIDAARATARLVVQALATDGRRALEAIAVVEARMDQLACAIEHVDRMAEDFERRTRSADTGQPTVPVELSPTERPPTDELDHRLARAVARALGTL